MAELLLQASSCRESIAISQTLLIEIAIALQVPVPIGSTDNPRGELSPITTVSHWKSAL